MKRVRFMGTAIVALASALVWALPLSAQANPADQKRIDELLKQLEKELAKAKPVEKRAEQKPEAEAEKAEGEVAEEDKIGKRDPLVPLSNSEGGDDELSRVYGWLERSTKEVPDRRVKDIEAIVEKLDADSASEREIATQDLLLLESDAARTLWRLRTKGSIEKRARIDTILRMLPEGEAHIAILARAARLTPRSLRAALAGNAADIELLLNRIAYAEIARFPRIWAHLLVSTRSDLQAKLVLAHYRKHHKGTLAELYFSITEHFAGTQNIFVSALFEEVARDASREDLYQMCEHSIAHDSFFRSTLMNRLRLQAGPKAFLEDYDAAKSEIRRRTILFALQLESEAHGKADAAQRQAWAGKYSSIDTGLRDDFIAMVMRERLSEVLAIVIRDAPDAKNLPALLTTFGSRNEWRSALATEISARARNGLLRWLPYSSLALSDQEAVLLDFLKPDVSDSARQSAAQMLRGYGSPRLVSELLKRFEAAPQDSLLAGLLAWHAPILREVVPEMLDNPRIRAIYDLVGPLTRAEMLRECSSESIRIEVDELAYSPLKEVKGAALGILAERRIGLIGRVLVAAPHLLQIDASMRASAAEAIGLLLLREEIPSDAEIVGQLRAVDQLAQKAIKEEIQEDEVLSELGKYPILAIFRDSWHSGGRETLLFALAMGNSPEIKAYLEVPHEGLGDPLLFRSLLADATDLRATLAKNRPLEVFLNAPLYNLIGEEATVVAALVRMAELRSLDSIPSEASYQQAWQSVIAAVVSPGQRPHLQQVLVTLNRSSHRESMLQVLRALAVVGNGMDLRDALDAAARRMPVSTIRLQVLRTAMVSQDIDGAWVARMERVLGDGVGTPGQELLGGLSECLANSNGTPEQERAVLAKADKYEREAAIRGLAVRGNLAALNATLLKLQQDAGQVGSNVPLPSIAHLFAGMKTQRDTRREYQAWYRSRFLWRFDASAGVYRDREGQ